LPLPQDASGPQLRAIAQALVEHVLDFFGAPLFQWRCVGHSSLAREDISKAATDAIEDKSRDTEEAQGACNIGPRTRPHPRKIKVVQMEQAWMTVCKILCLLT